MLNSRIKKVQPSVTLSISEEARRLKREGVPVIGFAAGEPDFSTPDFIKKSAIEAINSNFTKYTNVAGILELKEAISLDLKTQHFLHYDVSQIVVSCGAKHSIFNVIQVLCEDGDEVIIPAPYWVSYPEMVRLSGATPVVVSCSEGDGFKLTPEALSRAITPKTKLIILNSPSNPTGMVYSQADYEALSEVLLKTKAFVLSDEIYEHIVYDKKYLSLFEVIPELKDRGILVNGHSKAYSMTGWRIGYMASPLPIAKAVSVYQSHSTSNPCSISQKAALAALQGDRNFLKKNAEIFRERRDFFVKKLNNIPRVSCLNPEGAFYVFPNVQDICGNETIKLCERLLKEAHIAVVPGDAFGLAGYLRFSYALDLESIVEGSERFENWVRKEFC